MRIVVTGARGQLAECLADRCRASGDSLILLGRPDCDLEDAPKAAVAILKAKPDVIINAAAYTAVDGAEDEPENARRINGIAPGILASAAARTGVRFVQISTDYVYDGSATDPYDESALTAPLGVYGLSKFEGEEGVRNSGCAFTIVRTSWIHSPFGRNFVKSMLKLGRQHDALSVVDDQIGNPTSAFDVADGLLQMCRTWKIAPLMGLGETYHLAGTGFASWCQFAREIFLISGQHNGPTPSVNAVSTAQFPTKAKRPLNSRLNTEKFTRDFGYVAPHWQQSLRPVVEHLLRQ